MSVIDVRKYVITVIRKVEKEGTILKHVWNFNVYVTAGLGEGGGGGGITPCGVSSVFPYCSCTIPGLLVSSINDSSHFKFEVLFIITMMRDKPNKKYLPMPRDFILNAMRIYTRQDSTL